MPKMIRHVDLTYPPGAGGDDEFQGFVEYTFVRPNGAQLHEVRHHVITVNI
jgi:hypothetical protein